MGRIKWEPMLVAVGVATIGVLVLLVLPGGLSTGTLAAIGVGLIGVGLFIALLATPVPGWIAERLGHRATPSADQARSAGETLLKELLPFVDQWEKAQGKPVFEGDLLYGYGQLASYADKYASNFGARVENVRQGFLRAGYQDKEFDDYVGMVSNPIAARSVANGLRRLIDWTRA